MTERLQFGPGVHPWLINQLPLKGKSTQMGRGTEGQNGENRGMRVENARVRSARSAPALPRWVSCGFCGESAVISVTLQVEPTF